MLFECDFGLSYRYYKLIALAEEGFVKEEMYSSSHFTVVLIIQQPRSCTMGLPLIFFFFFLTQVVVHALVRSLDTAGVGGKKQMLTICCTVYSVVFIGIIYIYYQTTACSS